MQLATKYKGVTSALATVDIQAGKYSNSEYYTGPLKCLHLHVDTNECLTNKGGCHHNCHDSDESYSCSCNNAGPPEAICGWSGPAVGGEVVEIKLAREARGKFWT